MKTRRAPHIRIDVRLFDYIPDIKPSGFLVYVALKKFENRHNGRCYPSYATLAKTTGLDRSTVIDYVEILVKNNLIDKRAQFRDGHQTSNQYDLRTPSSPERGSRPVPPPQDRVEISEGGGGTTPPQPLSIEPELTKKQIDCPHREEDRGKREDHTYCRACWVDMKDWEAYTKINQTKNTRNNTTTPHVNIE